VAWRKRLYKVIVKFRPMLLPSRTHLAIHSGLLAPSANGRRRINNKVHPYYSSHVNHYFCDEDCLLVLV